ncbi:hypothetical protein OCAE111667_25335 [Occultella aeris]|uniref:Uncharacterized protein n=1 Tax=Occultella aeris TaxID=2761496 RepID=A0A7M4DJF0_9MICO|nr:hypothetical protein [Occultella aeris]VZO37164.1 hypothetical protein HALOF300_02257 [Occultella aeris]
MSTHDDVVLAEQLRQTELALQNEQEAVRRREQEFARRCEQAWQAQVEPR